MRVFLERYKRIVEDMYEEQAKADFDVWHDTPEVKSLLPFKKQLSWLQSNMLKIDDFLRRYVMSQEWKVRQMLVLECSNTPQVGETETGDEKNHDEEAGDDALQVEPVLERIMMRKSNQWW